MKLLLLIAITALSAISCTFMQSQVITFSLFFKLKHINKKIRKFPKQIILTISISIIKFEKKPGFIKFSTPLYFRNLPLKTTKN
jgi:hypothetical protein